MTPKVLSTYRGWKPRLAAVLSRGYTALLRRYAEIAAKKAPSRRANTRRFEVHRPGDYATLNSNQPRDRTAASRGLQPQ